MIHLCLTSCFCFFFFTSFIQRWLFTQFFHNKNALITCFLSCALPSCLNIHGWLYYNDLGLCCLIYRFLNLTTCTWIWMELYISVPILMMMMFTSEFQMIKSLLIFFTTWRYCFALLNLGRCSLWLLMVWLLEQKWTSSVEGGLGKTSMVYFRILFRLIKYIILTIADNTMHCLFMFLFCLNSPRKGNIS